jgi:hypothetical protein
MIQAYSAQDLRRLKRDFPHGCFTFKHYRNDPYTRKPEKEPYRVERVRNSYVNSGGALLLDLLIGAGGTAFNAANSFIGVGDSNIATTATMTDLQATLAATIAILSSTNASPIVLTTGTHGLTAGQTITVAGHLTNTAANGTWVITTPTSTTIGLVGSTGSGVGGTTGTVAQGNRFRKPMDATFPSRVAQVMTWQATLASGEAEWGTGIQEGVLANGFVAASSTILARAVSNQGVKVGLSVLTVTYDIHVP